MNKEITVNGKVYVDKDSIAKNTKSTSFKGMPYVIIRTYSAGVFAGYLKTKKGSEVVLLKARRIWQWAGANSLSELAMCGTAKPELCKFPIEVDSVTLLGVIEIIETTAKAQESISSVKVWKQ